VGNLGSFAVGFVTFMLTTPVRYESGIYDCIPSTPCPSSFSNCYTLLGWENVLGPLGCSRWAAAGVGLLVGLLVREVGRRRGRVAR